MATAIPPIRLALGLMSGMSMDGLDLALIRILGTADEERPDVTLLACETVPYEPGLVDRLQAARGPAGAESEALHDELPILWGAAVRDFLGRHQVDADSIAVLGSHGQTLFHRPRTRRRPAQTLQVGDGARLRRETGIATVSDFRQADIEAGGEGAPLVPLADWILYAGDETTACHNLGSIANVTVVAPRLEDVIAFDTGPANMLVDAFARVCPGSPMMDAHGGLSAEGVVDEDVLLTLYLKCAAWLAEEPPKSAGYGTFGPELVEAVLGAHPHARPHDLVRTAVEFTARTLREAYERFVLPRFPDLRRIRFSGGGVRNPTLMESIRRGLAESDLKIGILDSLWADAKEAVAFALLADRTLRGLPGNVPGATGAREAVVLGRLHP